VDLDGKKPNLVAIVGKFLHVLFGGSWQNVAISSLVVWLLPMPSTLEQEFNWIN